MKNSYCSIQDQWRSGEGERIEGGGGAVVAKFLFVNLTLSSPGWLPQVPH